MLFTVLGELVLPGGGAAWTSAVIDVFARLGIEHKATRQALMRSAADGWLDAEKVGRRTLWRLTDDAHRLLTDGAQRIYSFGAASQAWDGRWLLVSAHPAETDRAARERLRRRLAWAGFGSLAPGLWISPHPERQIEAEAALRAALVGHLPAAHIFVARRSGIGDERAMVETAWDLRAIQRQYAAFLHEFGSPGAADALARQIELVHAWRQFPLVDPALPRELLPADWRGLDAARLFAERRQHWSAAARLEWQRLNAEPHPPT
jgi:phenylacetic acid degradation operon negative regulatory protein